MKNLIRAEFFKLSKSFGYKVMLALSVGIGVLYSFIWISHSSRVTGYLVLLIMDSFVMSHTIFTSVFTAVFLCSEFSDRTMGQGLFCGVPRRSVFFSKLIVFFTGLLCLLSTVVVVTVVIMSIANGFGIELTVEGCLDVLAQAAFFWLVSAAIGGFFIFLAMATKNAVAAMGTGLGIAYILLVMTSNYVNAGWEKFALVKYSFVYQMFVLEDWEHLNKGLFLAVTLVTLISTLTASTLIFERMELK